MKYCLLCITVFPCLVISKSLKNLLVIAIIVMIHSPTEGQKLQLKDSVEKTVHKSPAFSLYKENYLITGTTLLAAPTKNNTDIKFQFSFKYRLAYEPILLGFSPYFSYSQKSFWNVYKDSAPIYELNYNPSLFIEKTLYRDNKRRGSLILSIEHESNGKDTFNGSRSWNYVAFAYDRRISTSLFATLKFWIPFGFDMNSIDNQGNPDLIKYIGYGEYSLLWILKKNKLSADIIMRKGWSWNWKGSLQIDLSYRLFQNREIYLLTQCFFGYSESLIDYQIRQSNLRIGIAFKPALT